MPKASSVMNTKLFTVQEDTPICEAVKLMVDNNITGLPVVTEDKRVLGIVTEKDLLSLYTNPEEQTKKVSDIMTCNVTCFSVDDDIIDICESLNFGGFRRVPIVSNGRLAGVISRRDIIKLILC